MKKLTAPFGWVGSKSKLAKEIISKFPKHGIYIEVFGGALNVLYRKDKSRLEKDDAFFYLDPPYVGTENYYKDIDGFGIREHEELARMLKSIKGKFLLSYNDSPIVRELYKDFTIVESLPLNYTLGCNVHKRKKVVSELFIMNYVL